MQAQTTGQTEPQSYKSFGATLTSTLTMAGSGTYNPGYMKNDVGVQLQRVGQGPSPVSLAARHSYRSGIPAPRHTLRDNRCSGLALPCLSLQTCPWTQLCRRGMFCPIAAVDKTRLLVLRTKPLDGATDDFLQACKKRTVVQDQKKYLPLLSAYSTAWYPALDLSRSCLGPAQSKSHSKCSTYELTASEET